jgi:hypothetical protein
MKKHKGIFGMSKIPVAAGVGTFVTASQVWQAYQQNGTTGAIYHATGYNKDNGDFHWQAAWNNAKPMVYGTLISYVAKELGAGKVTRRIPLVGKFLEV